MRVLELAIAIILWALFPFAVVAFYLFVFLYMAVNKNYREFAWPICKENFTMYGSWIARHWDLLLLPIYLVAVPFIALWAFATQPRRFLGSSDKYGNPVD